VRPSVRACGILFLSYLPSTFPFPSPFLSASSSFAFRFPFPSPSLPFPFPFPLPLFLPLYLPLILPFPLFLTLPAFPLLPFSFPFPLNFFLSLPFSISLPFTFNSFSLSFPFPFCFSFPYLSPSLPLSLFLLPSFFPCSRPCVQYLTCHISITVRDGHYGPPIGSRLPGVEWSRDWWRHVTPKGQTRDPVIFEAPYLHNGTR